MLGELAVLYLFLGGAGAGCVAACSLVDLLWLRETRRWIRRGAR